MQEHIVDENDVFICAKSFVGSLAPAARSPQTPSPPLSVSPGKSKTGLAKACSQVSEGPLQRLNSRVYDDCTDKVDDDVNGADKSKELV